MNDELGWTFSRSERPKLHRKGALPHFALRKGL